MNRDTFSFKEEDNRVTLKVDTLVPTKWLLVDRETGQVYQGSPQGHWDKLKTVERDNQ
jgi:hypothetical protein